MEATAPKTRELSQAQTIALLVALIAGLLAFVLYTLARQGPPDPNDKTLFHEQMSALGGIFLALLIRTQVTARKWTLALASTGLICGIAAPWLYRTFEPDTLHRAFALTLQSESTGIFAFGTAFLVKSTEPAER